jgi:hypothetical protein
MSVKTWNHNTNTLDISYEGRVLALSQRDIRFMMDDWQTGYFATVLNDKDEVVEVCYDQSMASGSERGSATVDATPEVMNTYYKILCKRYYNTELARLKAISEEIIKGSVVEVVSGRTAKGLKGTVVVTITGQYNTGNPYRRSEELKVGISLDPSALVPYTSPKNGKTYMNPKIEAWVWARNCKVVNPEQFVTKEMLSKVYDNARAAGRMIVEHMR